MIPIIPLLAGAALLACLIQDDDDATAPKPPPDRLPGPGDPRPGDPPSGYALPEPPKPAPKPVPPKNPAWLKCKRHDFGPVGSPAGTPCKHCGKPKVLLPCHRNKRGPDALPRASKANSAALPDPEKLPAVPGTATP